MILDSNVIIYSNQPGYEPLLDYLETNRDELKVSLITRLEVLGFHKITVQDKADFERFFSSVSVLPITREIIDEAIRLKQQRKRSPGDAIIAATGLVYDLPILTNNTKDFADVPSLRVIALADVLSA